MSEPFLSKIPNDCRASAGRNQTGTLGRGGQEKGYGEKECPPRPRIRRRRILTP